MVGHIYEYFYLFNIVVALLCLLGIYRSKKLILQVFFIFLYFTLHYTYGFIPFFEHDFGTYFVKSREVSRVEMGLIASAFFIFANSLIFIRAKENFSLTHVKKLVKRKSIIIFAVLITLFIAFSAISTVGNPTSFNLKTLLIRLFTLYSFFMIFLSLSTGKESVNNSDKDIGFVVSSIFLLLLSIDTLLLVQFFSGKTWVCCDLIRPSGLLFNPNNLGFWLFCVSSFFTIVAAENKYKKLNVLVQFMVALGMFFAAARALIIVTVIFHTLIFLVSFKKNKVVLPTRFNLGFSFVSFLILICLSVQMFNTKGSLELSLYRAKLTSDRVLLTPVVLLDFLIQKLPVKEKPKVISAYQEKFIAPEDDYRKEMSTGGSQNIHGRVNSESTDNGMIAYYRESPLPSFLWFLILLYPVIISFVNKRLIQNWEYFLSFYLTILIASFSLNVFVIMPSWVIIALVSSVYTASVLLKDNKEIA